MNSTFALTMTEMGLNPSLIIIISISGLMFIVGFIKSSQENEYKKLMDSFLMKNDEED